MPFVTLQGLDDSHVNYDDVDWSSSEDRAVLSAESIDGLGTVGCVAANVMTFIQDNVREQSLLLATVVFIRFDPWKRFVEYNNNEIIVLLLKAASSGMNWTWRSALLVPRTQRHEHLHFNQVQQLIQLG